MYPELFSIGPITIYSYGVLLAASYLLGLWLAMRRAKRWGLDPTRVLDRARGTNSQPTFAPPVGAPTGGNR